ncbi:DUF1684 domain-containing protein [Halobaculum sp. MBLA0147]|uniref:DUF1684 domain-containing protein n=1 Tax=Halobaculum sp. MBLA0147 TaxID=3079934 RepID=UPI00352498F3
MTTDAYVERVERDRAEKDEFFGEHPRSPVPTAVQSGQSTFEGLDYYPVDPAYRVEVALDEHDEPTELTVETTQDGTQRYHDVGTFGVSLPVESGSETVVLHAFRPVDDHTRLWVPFRDATSGTETYGAGRYLDLEDPDDRTDDGRWVLDFNRAYNPFCAYSEAYECPLVPRDNWLDVPVRAGERAPPAALAAHGDEHAE